MDPTERLMELVGINRALSEELELAPMLQKILDAVAELVDAEQAFLVLYDDQGGMEIAAGGKLQGQSLAGDRLSIASLERRSLLCLPLKLDGRVIGVLYVENCARRQAFEEQHLEWVEAFSHQAAIAMRNARRQVQVRRTNRNLRILNEVGKAVSSGLECDRLLALILDKIIEVTDASRTSLMLVNKQAKLEFRLGRDCQQQALTASDFNISTAIVAQAVREMHTQLGSWARPGRSASAVWRPEARPVMGVPMYFHRGQLLGLIYVDKQVDQPPFRTTEAGLVEQLADQVAIAINNATLLEKATIDSLTGVYQRSYFDQRLKEETSRAQRYKTTLSLLMLDLDHFKRLNDTHGHLAGDAVLRLVGRIVKRSTRGPDIAARYGGEEFAVIMPQIDLKGAVKVARRINQGIAQQDVLPYKVTVSIGAAELVCEMTDEKALIERADRALYRAKETGRNKVCLFSACD